MKLRLFTVFTVLAFGVIVAPVMAETFSDAGKTCTTDPKDDSDLPECGTRHDNECYPGGVLYRGKKIRMAARLSGTGKRAGTWHNSMTASYLAQISLRNSKVYYLPCLRKKS